MTYTRAPGPTRRSRASGTLGLFERSDSTVVADRRLTMTATLTGWQRLTRSLTGTNRQ